MYPANYLYTREHEWVRVEDEICILGITHFAQQELGEVVFVELPELGQVFDANEEIGTIESVKAVAEIYTPVAGEILEVNSALADDPELLNDDPHGDGWLVRIRFSSADDLKRLMNAEQYAEYAAGREGVGRLGHGARKGRRGRSRRRGVAPSSRRVTASRAATSGRAPQELAEMLRELGVGLARRPHRRDGAARDPGHPAARPDDRRQRAAAQRERGAGRHRAPGGRESSAALAPRHGLPRLRGAAGHPAQRAREPGLVHAVHALPGRDLAGPPGGAAQLPDPGDRPHRAADRQRLAARRGDRRRRGHPSLPRAGARRTATSSSSSADCHPQTMAVVETRARGSASRCEVGDPAARRRSTGVFGVVFQYPTTDGRVEDYRAAAQRAREAGARVVAACDLLALTLLGAAGRVGRRRRGRLGAALRRAAGLRRPARRLLRHPRRVQAPDARPPDRRVARRRGQDGAAHGAADPRAAHPAREGDLQHLHRAGAARDHGLDVRGLPRARGAAPHRPARPRPGRGPRRGPAPARLRPGLSRLLRHAARARSARARPASVLARCRGARHQPAPARRRTRWGSRSTRSPPSGGRRAAGDLRGRGAGAHRRPRWRPRSRPGLPEALRRTTPVSSPTRSSAATTPSTRCCATSSGSRRATCRSPTR